MALCEIESGTTIECGYTVGGINKIYLANWADYKAATVTISATPPNEGAVTDIVMPALKYFYEFEFTRSSGQALSEIQKTEGGASNFLHTIAMALVGVDQEFINLIKSLGLSRVVAIVESRVPTTSGSENRHFIFGDGNGLEVTVMTAGLGQAVSDLAGATLTMTSNEVEPMRELQPVDPFSVFIPTLLAP